MLGLRSHPQRSWIARRVRLRPAVPRPLPLDPGARGQGAFAGAWLDHVALSGVAAARRRGNADQPRGGRDAAAHGAAARRQARLARALREGRGSEPHRLVQGPRARGRRDPRRARGGKAPGGAHRRERRRGARGLRGASRAPRAGVRAGYHAAHHPRPDPPPRLYSVQAAGCAPVVKGFEAGAESCAPWPNPETIAAGLRVPAPLGDRLMLRALRESGGGAVAVTDGLLAAAARDLQTLEGIDASPEGGASLAGAIELQARGAFDPDDRVVIFNTGAGWLYRA